MPCCSLYLSFTRISDNWTNGESAPPFSLFHVLPIKTRVLVLLHHIISSSLSLFSTEPRPWHRHRWSSMRYGQVNVWFCMITLEKKTWKIVQWDKQSALKKKRGDVHDYIFSTDIDTVGKRRGMKVKSNCSSTVGSSLYLHVILIKQYNSGSAPAKCQAC